MVDSLLPRRVPADTRRAARSHPLALAQGVESLDARYSRVCPGMSISMAMGPVNRALASAPGSAPPAWWGPAGNPAVKVTGAADVFPDLDLTGNNAFVVLYLVIGFVFNIVGEEVYYRGYLLPHMRDAFGRWDWVANGVLFTLKHVYQRWLFPGLLVGGLTFAFAAGPLGSLPLAMVYHWVGNFLLQMVFLIIAALGGG